MSFMASLRLRLMVPTAAFALSMAALAATPAAPSGADMYRLGRLASGVPLAAMRDANPLPAASSACVNCHRPSGLGSYEGSITVPPIIGPYLFRPGAINAADLNLPHVQGYAPKPYAYNLETLRATLQSGIAPDGRQLSTLMPRYDFDEMSLRQLTDYLDKLATRPFIGVDAQNLHFATIVTPDVDREQRAAVLTVLEHFFAEREAAMSARVQAVRADASEYRGTRHWRLHVWDLTGKPDTWESQLRGLIATQPVFAVISGIGARSWAPVHRFCERARVPCLLPNIDMPPSGEGDEYTVYFSRGVLLEADLVAARLASVAGSGAAGPRARGRLDQVYRSGDVGAAAAARLAVHARAAGYVVSAHELPVAAESPPHVTTADAFTHAQLQAALIKVPRDAVLIIWLRPSDVKALGDHAPVVRGIYLSGQMAGLEEAPLGAEWRAAVRMTYPYDPPDRRRVRENFPHAWLLKQGIAVTDDQLQSNTFLSCGVLAEVLDGMLDAYVPEFLLERLEGMLGTRLATGYFPRLSLAPGQRYASKGGYLVKFAEADGNRVIADGAWTIPAE